MSATRAGASRSNLAGPPLRPKHRLYDTLLEDVAAAGLRGADHPEGVVTEADLVGSAERCAALPAVHGRRRQAP